MISVAKLKAFSNELDSYGGVRDLLEAINDEEPDALIEISRQYDCEGDFYDMIDELTEKIENNDIDQFIDIVGENVDEQFFSNYIEDVLG